MYAKIGSYTFDSQQALEFDVAIQHRFVPLLRSTPGFVAYYWFDTGNGSRMSISLFDDDGEAGESVQRTAAELHEQMVLIIGDPDVLEGRLKAYANAGI